MNIAAYCRVSTDKEDQLNSLEAQKEFFREYTKRSGDRLVKLYADEGISGTKIKNRKQFLQMMEDAQKGLFNMVVVKDISRFARNTVDLLQNIRRLKALGIETQFLTANMTSMGNSEFVLTVFGALAQEESANTSKRVKFGKKINAEKGRVPNLVYGYDKTAGDYFKLKINRGEAKVVREIFDMYVNGGYGASKIAGILNDKGITTKRGCKWSQNAICRILTNEIYVGRVINGKQEVEDFLTGRRISKSEEEWYVCDRPELRIIDDESFSAAAREMKSRGQNFKVHKERHSNRHLFSTLIKCKECGWSFCQTVKRYKNTYIKWVCSYHNRGAGNCANRVTVDEGELIKAIENYFSEILADKKNVINAAVEEFKRVYKDKDENLLTEREIKSEIARINRGRKKYMDMYTDDLITREELNRRISGDKKELERLEERLRLIERQMTKGDRLGEILSETFKQIADLTDLSNATNQQLKRIIDRIEVDRDGNVEIFLKLFKELGIDEKVQISGDRTQGRYRTLNARKSAALPQGKAGA